MFCGGMPAPKDVYSGFVDNHLDVQVIAKATYSRRNGQNDVVQATIAPNSSHEFVQKTYSEGSCEFTYIITHVEVSAGSSNVSCGSPFNGVNSPVKGFHWVVQGSASAPSISQHL